MEKITYTVKIELSKQAFELLKYIKENDCAEYRDTEFDTKEDFLKSDDYLVNNRSLEWFLARNSNGTFYLIDELLEYGLVDSGDGMSWHTTYYITKLGNQLINDNK